MIGIELLVFISCFGFLLFLIPGRHRKYAAILGWIFIVLTLFSLLPEYFQENNFMYPVMAALSVPFLAMTIKFLLRESEPVMYMTRGAAVAFLIYAPFGFNQIPLFAWLGNALIQIVSDQIYWILSALHYDILMTCLDPVSKQVVISGTCDGLLKNIFLRNTYSVEIILACTGIQSIAIMLGVAASVPTTLRQKILAFLIVAPTIYILNLLRNVFVIMAYTDQWFPWWQEIASNGMQGYESFFWAHNVIAELLALVCLVVIAFGLFTVIPRLGELASELYELYYREVLDAFGRGKKTE